MTTEKDEIKGAYEAGYEAGTKAAKDTAWKRGYEAGYADVIQREEQASLSFYERYVLEKKAK